MKFSRFLISKAFFKHLFYAIVLTLAIIFFTLGCMHVFTRHGRSKVVPDLMGKTVEEIQRTIKKARLQYNIIDSVFHQKEKKGAIVKQNPEAGFLVKKNRTIFLVINAYNPERVIMPNVIGVSIRQARAKIETAGLEIGELIPVPDPALNSVLRQQYQGEDVSPGDTIRKGSIIDLVIGGGLSYQETYAPELTGLLLEDARILIIEAALNIGAIIYDSTIISLEDSAIAFVWKQSPIFDIEYTVPLGSSLDIWLTSDSTKHPLYDSTLIDLPETDSLLLDTILIDGEKISNNF